MAGERIADAKVWLTNFTYTRWIMLILGRAPFFRNRSHGGGSNCKRSNISYKPPLQLYVRCITFAIRRNINIPSFGHAILHRNVHVIWHWVINIVVAGTPPICDRPMQPLTSFDRLHVCQCSQKPLIFFNAHFHHFQSNVIHFRFG